MSNLFLSYRRADCPDTVKFLQEKLKARLPRWLIFYDHLSIEPGEAFPERLRNGVNNATVVFVIIGPKWLELLQERQTAAIDHVREEIRLALEGQKRVVPLLVQNAKMPSESDLAGFPELIALPSLNCRHVRPEPDFDTDLEKLIAFLEPLGPSIDVGTVLSGRYKLTLLIGEGGMGVVYRAEQLHPKRTVAVKLIKPGMDSKEVLARFDAERQALAVMNHPNIAGVLDAGMTPNGLPFFVMDYVKGVPITQYCDDKKLNPNERLDLFCEVCEAVQHAHQKGIIHRDIKPSNVLVEEIDGKPVPKVIDFGLAKALSYRLTDKTLVSELGKTVGTLIYSSPEQAAGRVNDIDTRTDIYSLGILLYEMLAGSPPFTEEELASAGDDAMKQLIRDKEPPKPSTKLSSSNALPSIAANRHLDPAKLTKTIRGELDWIVMKALEKETSRRYATPTAFAEDLQRYLKHEPVTAGRPSAGYRLKKLVRRNKAVVAALGAVFLALTIGGAIAAWGWWETNRAVDAEKRAVKRAEDNEGIAKEEERKTQDALRKETESKRALDVKIASLSIATQFAADAAFAEGRAARAKSLLREVPVQHRGFEWHHRMRIFTGGYATLFGHTDTVDSVSFSPDGRRVASASRDKTVKVWDAESGAELRTLKGHTDAVDSVSFSPDGRRVASASRDKTVKVWDAESGAELRTLKEHTGYVHSVSFSPDGRRIASGSSDGTARVWDADTGAELRTLNVVTVNVFSVSFSPDGQRIVTGSDDRKVKLWDVESGAELRTLKGHMDSVHSVSFSPDGRRIASGSSDRTARVWDADTGAELRTLKGHTGYVFSVSFSPDGRRIVSGSFDKTMRVWDADTGAELRTLKGHMSYVNSVSFSPDAWRIASGSDDGTVKLWDAEWGAELRSFEGCGANVLRLSFSPDGRHIVSSSVERGNVEYTTKVLTAE